MDLGSACAHWLKELYVLTLWISMITVRDRIGISIWFYVRVVVLWKFWKRQEMGEGTVFNLPIVLVASPEVDSCHLFYDRVRTRCTNNVQCHHAATGE